MVIISFADSSLTYLAAARRFAWPAWLRLKSWVACHLSPVPPHPSDANAAVAASDIVIACVVGASRRWTATLLRALSKYMELFDAPPHEGKGGVQSQSLDGRFGESPAFVDELVKVGRMDGLICEVFYSKNTPRVELSMGGGARSRGLLGVDLSSVEFAHHQENAPKRVQAFGGSSWAVCHNNSVLQHPLRLKNT